MRGICISFLFLLTLFVGSVSSVNAQNIDVWVESGASGRLFAGCPMNLTIQIQGDDILMRNTVQRKVIFKCTGAAEYTDLPESVELVDEKITIPFSIAKMPESVHGTEGTITVFWENQPDQKSDTTYVFYNRPTYEFSYIKPTLYFSGKMELTIEGGSPYMLRQWANGGEPVDARLPFSTSEIANSSEGDILYLWEPNSCWEASIELTSNSSGGTDPGPSPVTRLITIPFLANADTEPAAGVHYVNSMADFKFKIIPHSGYGAPIVTTDRNVPDEDGVVMKSNDDGTYEVTILRVQTATNINIQIPVENELISAQKVWAENNLLYLSSVIEGKINIYNITGQLIKTITLSSGETIRIPLPKGLYMIVFDNQKVHKIVIK